MASPTSRTQPGGPKYINDFSKALAVEVKILLEEVGKLRDEKRALQFEIAELMSIKAKHSAHGLYEPGWQPPPQIEAPPAEPAAPLPPAPGGWRTVHPPPAPRRKQPKQLQGEKQKQIASAPAAPSPTSNPNLPAWAQWRPNPLLNPGVSGGQSTAVVPPRRDGLFGPKTPPPRR
ncbi:hypothetical protein K438DRAFT_2012117 [Mycena galopus ATCC 62051]|nr:hypothetical protein K438DRAFT_2012117 [Mycena galopus ATCC 62051]